MPAPSRPGPPPKTGQQDVELWKSYTKALQTKFFGSLDPNTEVFCASPINKIAIPAGSKIHQEITNKVIADIGDNLVDLNVPIFRLDSKKYSERVSLLISSVALKNNPDKGAVKRFNDAKSKAAKLDAEFHAFRDTVLGAFNSDEGKGSITFKQWVPQNYPSFWSLGEERQRALATEASLRAQVEGPGASQLNDYRHRSILSLDPWSEARGMNMYTVELAGEVPREIRELPETASRVLRPQYAIESSFKDAVDNWNNNEANGGSASGLSFSLAESNAANWRSFGFLDADASQANFGASLNFLCTVRYAVNHVLKQEHISAQDAGSELSLKLTAADFKIFSITPGEWDVPNVTELYPRFENRADMNLVAAGRVDQILVGYKVGLVISASAQAVERIKNLISKAVSTRGSINFLGYDIDLSSDPTLGESIIKNSTSTSISIPARDRGYPVLLGVKAKRIPAVKFTRV